MLKLYTRFHVQERFSWLSFVICILKSTFRYLNFFTFYRIYLAFGFIPFFWSGSFQGQREKGSFTVANSGRSDIYSLPVFLRFALEICRGYLPLKFAAVFCRGNLPREFAAAICRDFFPWEFAVAILFFLFIILRRYRFLIYKFTNITMNINSYTNYDHIRAYGYKRK